MSSVSDLLTQLKLHAANDAHAEVYALARTYLAAHPASSVALKSALVALVKMDRYATASTLLVKYPAAVEENPAAVLVEQAYVYYKLNRSKDLQQLVPLSTPDRALKHILAQDLYRAGESDKALKLYRSLIQDNRNLDDETELGCNERAVLSQNPTSAPLTPDSASTDQQFNTALIQIARKEYSRAIATLSAAHDPAARIQTAYAHQMLGETDTAAAILKALDLDDSFDKLIAANNLYSLGEKDALSVTFSFANALQGLRPALTTAQVGALERNQAVLAHLLGKKVTSDPDASSSLLPASLAVLSRYNINIQLSADAKADAKVLYHKSLARPNDLPLALTAAQFNCDVKNFDNAVLVLENVFAHNTQEAEHLLARPGITGLLLALYEQLKREKAAVSLLARISDYYSFKLVDDNFEEFQYVKRIAFKLLPHDSAKAHRLLEELSMSCDFAEDDVLIQSFLNKTDEGLTTVEALTAAHSVDALMEQGLDNVVVSTRKKSHKISKARRNAKYPKALLSQIDATLPKAEQRQQLHALLAKKPADDERWLPLKDRSTFRPKKGKGKTATQGSISGVAVDDKLEDGIPAPKAKKVVPKSKKKKGKK